MNDELPLEPIGTDHVSTGGFIYFIGERVFRGKAYPEDYSRLIFGTFSIEQILPAINDPNWQLFRASLKGLTVEEKLNALVTYVWDNTQPRFDGPNPPSMFGDVKVKKGVAIRVTNYINALKRGGQLK